MQATSGATHPSLSTLLASPITQAKSAPRTHEFAASEIVRTTQTVAAARLLLPLLTHFPECSPKPYQQDLFNTLCPSLPVDLQPLLERISCYFGVIEDAYERAALLLVLEALPREKQHWAAALVVKLFRNVPDFMKRDIIRELRCIASQDRSEVLAVAHPYFAGCRCQRARLIAVIARVHPSQRLELLQTVGPYLPLNRDPDAILSAASKLPLAQLAELLQQAEPHFSKFDESRMQAELITALASVVPDEREGVLALTVEPGMVLALGRVRPSARREVFEIAKSCKGLSSQVSIVHALASFSPKQMAQMVQTVVAAITALKSGSCRMSWFDHISYIAFMDLLKSEERVDAFVPIMSLLQIPCTFGKLTTLIDIVKSKPNDQRLKALRSMATFVNFFGPFDPKVAHCTDILVELMEKFQPEQLPDLIAVCSPYFGTSRGLDRADIMKAIVDIAPHDRPDVLARASLFLQSDAPSYLKAAAYSAISRVVPSAREEVLAFAKEHEWDEQIPIIFIFAELAQDKVKEALSVLKKLFETIDDPGARPYVLLMLIHMVPDERIKAMNDTMTLWKAVVPTDRVLVMHGLYSDVAKEKRADTLATAVGVFADLQTCQMPKDTLVEVARTGSNGALQPLLQLGSNGATAYLFTSSAAPLFEPQNNEILDNEILDDASAQPPPALAAVATLEREDVLSHAKPYMSQPWAEFLVRALDLILQKERSLALAHIASLCRDGYSMSLVSDLLFTSQESRLELLQALNTLKSQIPHFFTFVVLLDAVRERAPGFLLESLAIITPLVRSSAPEKLDISKTVAQLPPYSKWQR